MSNFLKLISFTYALLLVSTSNQIYSSEKRQIDIKSNNLISNVIEKKEIKSVTANGFGITIESAAQNAAENALTNVVGSFLDVQTLLKEKTKISDGILSETTIIKENINDYSQGTIKYFEILNVQENNSIYSVTARVDVRIDDFKAYIKELASDNLTIDQDLFTSIKVEESNKKQRSELLVSVLNPVVKGEVIDIERGNQQLLEDFSSFGCEYNHKRESLICRDENNADYIQVSDLKKRGTIVFPYILKLNQEFKTNAKKKLDNISDFKKTLPTYYDYSSRNSYERLGFLKKYQRNDYIVEIVNNDLKTSDLYIFNQLLVDDPNFITNPRSNDYYSMRFSFRDLNNQEICMISPNIFSNSLYEGIFKTFKCLNSKMIIRFVQVVGNPYGGSARGHNFSAWNYSGIKTAIINDQTQMLLIIEPSEDFLKEVKNISLEIVHN